MNWHNACNFENMDPITLISILYKISMISPQKNNDIDERSINKKNRTEIIELYRSNMVNENKMNN
tara:strand:+ start:588 stop:782 length:195 start_codon:yes stop_codon:yes gene_type:complete